MEYNYDDGSDTTNIALAGIPESDPFVTWVTTTNGLVGGDAAPTADPDNDGLDNLGEFAIGGERLIGRGFERAGLHAFQ